MPTYTYKCLNKQCSKEYDQSFSYVEKEKPRCPHCKSRKARKVITFVPLVTYIGDGFTKKTS